MTHEPRDSCKMGNPLPSRTLPCAPVPSAGRCSAGATPRLSRPPVHRDCQHAATTALCMGIWEDIHPSWGKSAVNLHSGSPILAICFQNYGVQAIQCSHGLWEWWEGLEWHRSSIPCIHSSQQRLFTCRSRWESWGWETIFFICLILYWIFSRSMNHSFIWRKWSPHQLTIPGCCCIFYKERKFLDPGYDLEYSSWNFILISWAAESFSKGHGKKKKKRL